VREVENRLVASVQKIVDENGRQKLSTGISSTVSENNIQVRIFLTDPEVRPLTTSEVTRIWRKQIGTVTGVETIAFAANQGGPGSGKGLTISLSHRDADLLNRYPGLSYGLKGKQAHLKESMTALFKGLGLSLFCVFALLAIPFKSYFQPLIIMVCIPFGIIGAVAGHIIMGYSMSILSLFGIVVMAGVVINDALMLIHLQRCRWVTFRSNAFFCSGTK